MTTTISGYELGDVVGHDSSSETSFGIEQSSGVAVIAKIIRSPLADDSDSVERLRADAQLLARIEHPITVPIREIIVESGVLTIISEKVVGADLRQLLSAESTFAPARAAHVIGDVLSALSAAHRVGLVHGGVKSETVLIAGDGKTRIADFGVARFMTPELISPAGDVYSAAALLCELVTGSWPFFDEDGRLVRSSGLPDKLWDLLAAMLSDDRDERPSAADARLRLAALMPRLSFLEPQPPVFYLVPVEDVAVEDTAASPPVLELELVDEAETETVPGVDAAEVVETAAPTPLTPLASKPSVPAPPVLPRPPAAVPTALDVPAGPPAPTFGAVIATKLAAMRAAAATVVTLLVRRRPVQPAGTDDIDDIAGIDGTVRDRPRLTLSRIRPARAWMAFTSSISTLRTAWPNEKRATKVAVVTGVAIVIVAIVAAAARLWLVSPTSPTASYAFAPASYRSGLVVTRKWTLTGGHSDQLTETLILIDGAKSEIAGSYDEVIPKSVAGFDSAISFRPEPNEVVQSDPVVRYHFDLQAGAALVFSYVADVGDTKGSISNRLKVLASDQVTAQNAYLYQSAQALPATLSEVSVAPKAVSLAIGQSATATLVGMMSDGTTADAAVLSGALWSSADNSVAQVIGNTITATGTGKTTVTAQAGDLTATVAVSVVGDSSSIEATATTAPSSPGSTSAPAGNASITPGKSKTTGRSSAGPPPPASSAPGTTSNPPPSSTSNPPPSSTSASSSSSAATTTAPATTTSTSTSEPAPATSTTEAAPDGLLGQLLHGIGL